MGPVDLLDPTKTDPWAITATIYQDLMTPMCRHGPTIRVQRHQHAQHNKGNWANCLLCELTNLILTIGPVQGG